MFLGLPVSRMILSEFWVDKLSRFYSHNGNREIQVRFLQEGWFCNFFFWVKVIPLLYSKVWCDSATYPQGRPPPTSRFLNYLIKFSWSIYWASYSILLLVNLKVVLTIPSSQLKFPPCPLAPNFENPVTDNGAGLVESWGPGQLPGKWFHFPGPFYIQAETDGPQGNESLPAVWPHPASLHHQGWGWVFYKTWQRMQWRDLHRRSGGLALRTWCLFALRSLALRPSTALLLCWLLQPTEKKKVFSPLRAARRQKGPIHNKFVLTLPHPHLQPSYQPWVGQKRWGKFCRPEKSKKIQGCSPPPPPTLSQGSSPGDLEKGKTPFWVYLNRFLPRCCPEKGSKQEYWLAKVVWPSGQ